MKLILAICISAVFIQEVVPGTLVRFPRNTNNNPSYLHTEYEAHIEQTGKHGNESYGKVSGKQAIEQENCNDDWNTFANKCAELIKDLVASLANAVSSKPGDATNLQLHIKNTFRHLDKTHNCSCLNNNGTKLSDIDLSQLFDNLTLSNTATNSDHSDKGNSNNDDEDSGNLSSGTGTKPTEGTDNNSYENFARTTIVPVLEIKDGGQNGGGDDNCNDCTKVPHETITLAPVIVSTNGDENNGGETGCDDGEDKSVPIEVSSALPQYQEKSSHDHDDDHHHDDGDHDHHHHHDGDHEKHHDDGDHDKHHDGDHDHHHNDDDHDKHHDDGHHDHHHDDGDHDKHHDDGDHDKHHDNGDHDKHHHDGDHDHHHDDDHHPGVEVLITPKPVAAEPITPIVENHSLGQPDAEEDCGTDDLTNSDNKDPSAVVVPTITTKGGEDLSQIPQPESDTGNNDAENQNSPTVAIPVLTPDDNGGNSGDDCNDNNAENGQGVLTTELPIAVVPVVQETDQIADQIPVTEAPVLVQPTTFQTTSEDPTYSPVGTRPSPDFVSITTPQKVNEETENNHNDDDEEDDDCCSCESCSEDEESDPKKVKENVCKSLDEARKELKAIFDKIKKKLRCCRKEIHTITTNPSSVS